MNPEQIYYEPKALDFELGKKLREKFGDAAWIPIENHNSIEELRSNPNKEFGRMKRLLIIGVREKTHKYVVKPQGIGIFWCLILLRVSACRMPLLLFGLQL
jgi:hypothetical protein